MHDRIRFIDHRGKKILLADFSNCSANEVDEIAQAAPDYLTVQPRNSVLVLTDFSGAAFDRDALRAMKETAVFDKPFLRNRP
jgi:mannose/fructose-specific phosphotransferase system component IIA